MLLVKDFDRRTILDYLGGPQYNHKYLYERETEAVLIKRRRQCDHRGRHWIDAAINQDTPEPPELRRGKKHIFSRTMGVSMALANTLIPGF